MCLFPAEIVSAVRRAVSVKPDVVMSRPLVAPCGSRLPENVRIFQLSDQLRPAFSLDIDAVKAEGIEVDDAVYATVSSASEMVGPSIADGLKEIEDGLLEALGLEVGEGVEDVGSCNRSEGRGVRSEE